MFYIKSLKVAQRAFLVGMGFKIETLRGMVHFTDVNLTVMDYGEYVCCEDGITAVEMYITLNLYELLECPPSPPFLSPSRFSSYLFVLLLSFTACLTH